MRIDVVYYEVYYEFARTKLNNEVPISLIPNIGSNIIFWELVQVGACSAVPESDLMLSSKEELPNVPFY